MLANIMNIVLWWHTVGTGQSIMLLKYTAALYPCCCKMPQNPLWSCTVTSLSPFFHSALNTHCWLLIFPLSPPLSHPSHTSSSASTSPLIFLPFSLSFWYFFTHSSSVTIASLYPLLLLIFPQTSNHKALHVRWWDIEGGREVWYRL